MIWSGYAKPADRTPRIIGKTHVRMRPGWHHYNVSFGGKRTIVWVDGKRAWWWRRLWWWFVDRKERRLI